MTGGSVMREINFLPPWQWGQTRTSISKALFINSAQVRHFLSRLSLSECGHSFGEPAGSIGRTIESLQDAAGASTPW